MNSFIPIKIEWNCYNGFIFEILYIESFKYLNLDGSLFGFSFSWNSYLHVDILFKNIVIFENF